MERTVGHDASKMPQRKDLQVIVYQGNVLGQKREKKRTIRSTCTTKKRRNVAGGDLFEERTLERDRD